MRNRIILSFIIVFSIAVACKTENKGSEEQANTVNTEEVNQLTGMLDSLNGLVEQKWKHLAWADSNRMAYINDYLPELLKNPKLDIKISEKLKVYYDSVRNYGFGPELIGDFYRMEHYYDLQDSVLKISGRAFDALPELKKSTETLTYKLYEMATYTLDSVFHHKSAYDLSSDYYNKFLDNIKEQRNDLFIEIAKLDSTLVKRKKLFRLNE